MITTEQIIQHCDNLKLPTFGREYLKRVASSPPGRRVRSFKNNVLCRYPSKKMGMVIQAESHRHELALVHVLEHDPEVIAFWDQPEAIRLNYLSASGNPASPDTTPDYLVLRVDGVLWYEVKPDEVLPELAEKMPRRYVRGGDGKWRCPPGEATAGTYGYEYRIWTPSEVNPTRLRNLQMLADYFGTDLGLVPDKISKHLREVAQSEPGISLENLRRRCDAATADHVNLLLVHDQLYVDLAAAPLTEPRQVRVYSCREAAETYALLIGSDHGSGMGTIGGGKIAAECTRLEEGKPCAGRNGSDYKTYLPEHGALQSPGQELGIGSTGHRNGKPHTIENVSSDNIGMLVNGTPNDLTREVLSRHVAERLISSPNQIRIPQLEGDAARLFRRASPEDHGIAIQRHHVLTDPEFAKAQRVPMRTLRRWRRMFRLAETRYGYGLLGLFPRFKDRGHRGPRFGDELLCVVDRVIDEVYGTPARPNRRHAFDQLRLECERQGFITPSCTWFNRRIAMRSKYSLTLAREGKRVAHRYEIIRPGEPNDNHGAFPWDVCLTDHTLVDLELLCSETGENLGRAWLSTIIDGFSRRILALCLTYDPPSYRTLMMLVRRCVERHERLPGTLIVDGGKEFQSIYFESLTAAYGVLVKRRPPGKARFGSIIERAFGTINTMFLHTLPGNTQNTRNIRQLTKSMNPKGHAIYTLEELHNMLSIFAFEIYENRPHPTLNCSPAEKYAKGVEISGARDHRAVKNDEAFHLMTLPATPKGTAKIQPGMGLKIGGFYYWAQEMRSRQFEGKSVRVKFDPENIGVAWAYLGDQWVQCRPNGTLNLEGRTEKEMRLATLEWRRLRQRLGQRQSNSHRDLAEFLNSTEAAKALRIQQAKDRAQRRTRSSPMHERTAPSITPADAAAPPASADPAPTNPPEAEPPPSSPSEDYGDF